MKRLLARLRYSLSARLMTLFLLTALALAFILGQTLELAMGHYFRRVIRPHLLQYLEYVRQDIGDPPNIDSARELTQTLPVEIYISGPQVNWSSTPKPLDIDDHEFRRRLSRRGQTLAVADDDHRSALRTFSGDHRIDFVIDNRSKRRAPHVLMVGLAALAAMLLLLYLCYRAIRRLFRPVQAIQTGVQRFAGGELDHRIAIRRRDELGDLGHSINAMADDIEKMLDAKRQLLLAVSHELRSPITRAKVSTELLDDSAPKQAIADDLREMESLIGEILETERLNIRHRVLDTAPVAIDRLVREVVAEHFADNPPELALQAEDRELLLDAARIKLLLRNLLDNAIRHNRSDRDPPVVRTERRDGQVVLQVADHGEGIAAEHLPHLSEPFYRADPSRQRQTGGFGLGLYLCRMIAEAHGGSLEIDSTLGRGTVVTVRFAAS